MNSIFRGHLTCTYFFSGPIMYSTVYTMKVSNVSLRLQWRCIAHTYEIIHSSFLLVHLFWVKPLEISGHYWFGVVCSIQAPGVAHRYNDNSHKQSLCRFSLLEFPCYRHTCTPVLKADIANLFIPAAVFTNVISNSRRKSFIILAKVIQMSASVENVHTVSGYGHGISRYFSLVY